MPLYSVSEVGADGRRALVSGFINPAGVAAWSLQLLVFTTPGLFVSVAAVAVVLYSQFPERPWLMIAAPLYLLPLVVLAFALVIISTITNLATEWAFRKLWGKPDPAKVAHRVGYFMLSVPLWISITFIFG